MLISTNYRDCVKSLFSFLQKHVHQKAIQLNCLSVFDHFVGLVLKGLKKKRTLIHLSSHESSLN